MAIIRQESSFQADAQPPRSRILWIIPGPRPSSAYGYSQALDGTWDWYRQATAIMAPTGTISKTPSTSSAGMSMKTGAGMAFRKTTLTASIWPIMKVTGAMPGAPTGKNPGC